MANMIRHEGQTFNLGWIGGRWVVWLGGWRIALQGTEKNPLGKNAKIPAIKKVMKGTPALSVAKMGESFEEAATHESKLDKVCAVEAWIDVHYWEVFGHNGTFAYLRDFRPSEQKAIARAALGLEGE